MTLWSGRVDAQLAPEVWDFLHAHDAELLPYDLQGTLLHAQRLHAAGILTDAELAEVTEKLSAIDEVDPADEDVHSSIERQLGEVGRKIHAGRSRNDQVAAAFRLYVIDCLRARPTPRSPPSRARSSTAPKQRPTRAMPGYTHLQRAQPVTLGHHLLAWVEMLERDRARFAFAAAQAAPSPLGAGALAGSTLPIPAPPNQLRNSIDAVADRDFALDYLYASAVLFTHLSRIGEEIVLWTTSEFGFARLPEEAATGSSIMPQKLNPDVAELARGKAGTAVGRLVSLLVTVKGLPLAYNRDLQQDKPPVFTARADIAGALGALTILVSGLAFDRERLASAAADPLLRATDAAEALVAEGVPFRDAHEQVAAEVRAGTFQAPAPGDRLGRRARRRPSRKGALVVTTPLSISLAGRDLLRISDLAPAEAEQILDLAVDLKADPRRPLAPGATLGLYFSKHSTRTRVSFSVAMAHLGGTAIALSPDELQISRGESLPDTARALSRYVDALAVRTHAHEELEAWAEWASVPVINALTAEEHPCQALADALTIRDRLGALDGVRVAWVGDGSNVLVSLAALGKLLGYQVVSACPPGYEAAGVENVVHPRDAVAGANVVVTDTWISMGQEHERAKRLRDLEPYRLDSALLSLAAPDAFVMHCLPAHAGEEITADLLYGDRSAIWDEAENRLHVQKALLALLLDV